MVTIENYNSTVPNAWCPGCGNFGILQAVKKALIELEIEPHRLLFVSGIGQGPKLPHYTRGNVFNGLHGRTLPVATGAKIANHELTVIGIDGDGGAYGEGVGHLLASMRRNVDITYLAHNNQVYGLTKGQASPTSDTGFITKTTPDGASTPVNPLALAIISGAGFVSRGFAGDVASLTSLIRQGITHRGFSLIDILQPCVSFNQKNTYTWYRERVYKLEDEPGYNPGNKETALARALEWGDRIPTGIIYAADLPVYEDRLPALRKGAPVGRQIDPARATGLLAEFI